MNLLKAGLALFVIVIATVVSYYAGKALGEELYELFS